MARFQSMIGQICHFQVLVTSSGNKPLPLWSEFEREQEDANPVHSGIYSDLKTPLSPPPSNAILGTKFSTHGPLGHRNLDRETSYTGVIID